MPFLAVVEVYCTLGATRLARQMNGQVGFNEGIRLDVPALDQALLLLPRGYSLAGSEVYMVRHADCVPL